MFHIALFEPQIAPNTGNILRLIANNGCDLHLIGTLGFDLEERKLRRAGLDYRDMQKVTRYPDYPSFVAAIGDHRIFAVTTRGGVCYADIRFSEGDVLLFGSETAGLPDSVRACIPAERTLRIPMCANNRSLNLSNAVALVSYEAWRQNGFSGGS